MTAAKNASDRVVAALQDQVKQDRRRLERQSPHHTTPHPFPNPLSYSTLSTHLCNLLYYTHSQPIPSTHSRNPPLTPPLTPLSSRSQVKKDEAEIASLKSDLAALRAANDNHTRTLSAFEDEVNKHVDARAAGSRDLDSVQKAKQALDKRMADLEAQGRKDQDTINDLRKQVAKLQSEKDANDAAAQQRISFLEGQGKKDTEEIAYLKRQVVPTTIPYPTLRNPATLRYLQVPTTIPYATLPPNYRP